MKLSKINVISFISGGWISTVIFLSSQIFLLWSFQCSIDTIHCYRFVFVYIVIFFCCKFPFDYHLHLLFSRGSFPLKSFCLILFSLSELWLALEARLAQTWHLLITASWTAGIGITVCSIIRIFLPLPFSSFIFPPQLLSLFSYFHHCLKHF